MFTYVYVRFVIGLLSFFAPLGPLGLIIVWHFSKKCGNAAVWKEHCRRVWACLQKGDFSRSAYPWQHGDTIAIFTFP